MVDGPKHYSEAEDAIIAAVRDAGARAGHKAGWEDIQLVAAKGLTSAIDVYNRDGAQGLRRAVKEGLTAANGSASSNGHRVDAKPKPADPPRP